MSKLDKDTITDMLAHYRALKAWSDDIQQNLEEGDITPAMLLDAMLAHEAEAPDEARDSLAFLALAGSGFPQMLQDPSLSSKEALAVISRYYDAQNEKKLPDITAQTRPHLLILAQNGADMEEILRLALVHKDIAWLVPSIIERVENGTASLPGILKVLNRHYKAYPGGARILLPFFVTRKADPAALLHFASHLESVGQVADYIRAEVLEHRADPTQLFRTYAWKETTLETDIPSFLIEQGADLKTVFTYLLNNKVDIDVIPAIRNRLDQEPGKANELLSVMEELKKGLQLSARNNMPGKLLSILLFCGADAERVLDVALDTRWQKSAWIEKILEQALPSRLCKDKSLANKILCHLDLRSEQLQKNAKPLLPLLAASGADLPGLLKLAMRNKCLQGIRETVANRLEYGTTDPDALLSFWHAQEDSYSHQSEIGQFFSGLVPNLIRYGADLTRLLPVVLRRSIVEDNTIRPSERTNTLAQMLPHIEARLLAKTANPSILLETLDRIEEERLQTNGEKPKKQDELVSLLSRHGADFSGCKHLKGDLHWQHYNLNGIRPAVLKPVIASSSSCHYRNRAQLSKTHECCTKYLAHFVSLHKVPAMAAIMAKHAGYLRTLASECENTPEGLLQDIEQTRTFWQGRQIPFPQNSSHLENAAQYASPETLYALLKLLPATQERADITRLLMHHLTLTEDVMQAAEQNTMNQMLAFHIQADQARANTKKRLEPVRQTLKNTPGTIIEPNTLARLERLAAEHDAKTAINTLNTQPQSFDVYFVRTYTLGKTTFSLRPLNWLRTRFYGDAVYTCLADYRKDLANWQEKDPDGSFACLQKILTQQEETAAIIRPLDAQAKVAEEESALFKQLAQEARQTITKIMMDEFAPADAGQKPKLAYTPILKPLDGK